jgi:hypothetical protein
LVRAYVLTTGVVFGLLTLAHLWRLYVEGPRWADPWFLLFTVLGAAFCSWAVFLLRVSGKS